MLPIIILCLTLTITNGLPQQAKNAFVVDSKVKVS